MKIGMLIGGLGRGGAERQLIRLAKGLVERGHEVEVLTYAARSPDDQELEGTGVIHHRHEVKGFAAKLRLAREWIGNSAPDVIHGFMHRASTLAALADRRFPGTVIVGSDGSTATHHRTSRTLWPALVAFRRADCIVTQTRRNERSLRLLAPWLRGKTAVIRNGLDCSAFRPPEHRPPSTPFIFCAVGTVYHVKNPVRLVRAVALLRELTDQPFRVVWHGRYSFAGDHAPTKVCLQAKKERKRLGVENLIEFRGENRQVEQAYREAHAFIHPSVQEGFPNVVVEAMATGLPLAVSGVSDLPLVVETARNGFVFNERRPQDIARAMKRMMALSDAERAQMGERSRALAEDWFGSDRFVDEFVALYRQLLEKRRARVG